MKAIVLAYLLSGTRTIYSQQPFWKRSTWKESPMSHYRLWIPSMDSLLDIAASRPYFDNAAHFKAIPIETESIVYVSFLCNRCVINRRAEKSSIFVTQLKIINPSIWLCTGFLLTTLFKFTVRLLVSVYFISCVNRWYKLKVCKI